MDVEGAAIETENHADSAPKGRGKARLKTIQDLDGRTKARQDAEAMRDALIADLGGAESLSKFQLLQIENVALTAALLRDLQVKALLGKSVDPTRMATCENTLNRTIERVNAGRPARRGVTPIEITNTRDLARAVLDVLRMAELEDAPDSEPAQLAPPAAPTEPDGTLEHAAPAPEPENPKPDYVYFETDAETVLNNEARVTRAASENGETFWHVTDANGMFHRKERDRAEAIEFARSLPGWKPGPEIRAHYTINGAEVDVNQLGDIPREARATFFDGHKRPRVIRSRRQLRT